MILIFWSLITSTCFAFTGAAMGGFVELSGFAKDLVVREAIPVGSIQSSYGYEVWDTSGSGGDTLSRVTLCSSNLEVGANAKVLGVSFGGEVSRFKTVGICDGKPKTLAGEELAASFSYDLAPGTKSVPIKAAFHFNISVSILLDKLELYFKNQPSPRSPHERLSRLFKHMIQVTAQLPLERARKVESILFKIFLHTFMTWTDPDNEFKLSKEEISTLTNTNNYSIGEFPAGLLDALYRSPSFYQLQEDDADEVYLDFVNFKEYFLAALYDANFCHSIDFSLDVGSSYNLELIQDIPISLAVSYGIAEIDHEFESDIKPEYLAAIEFSRHLFSTHSEACKNLSGRTGFNFGRLLGMFRPRKLAI